MDNYFIAAGIDIYNSIYWLQNTDPIVWSRDKSLSKRYECLSDADFDIRLNEDTFRLIFNSSSMDRIEIYEIKNGNIESIYCTLKKGI